MARRLRLAAGGRASTGRVAMKFGREERVAELRRGDPGRRGHRRRDGDRGIACFLGCYLVKIVFAQVQVAGSEKAAPG